MNKISVVFLSVLFPLLGYADENRAANINQGNLLTGGSVSFSSTSQSIAASTTTSTTSSSTLSLTAPLQYFFFDHWAIGGTFAFSRTSTNIQLGGVASTSTVNTVAIGPAVTYFFWASERFAAFLNAAAKIAYDDISRQSAWTLSGHVGVDYFLTPSVAIGPSLGVTRYFGNSVTAANTQFSMVGNFSIFL